MNMHKITEAFGYLMIKISFRLVAICDIKPAWCRYARMAITEVAQKLEIRKPLIFSIFSHVDIWLSMT